jgi:hypothetical protein
MCVLAASFHVGIFKSPVGAYRLRLGAFIFGGETPWTLLGLGASNCRLFNGLMKCIDKRNERGVVERRVWKGGAMD